jgi:RNA polymerase sigma-70 factor (ECF subfamily)
MIYDENVVAQWIGPKICLMSMDAATLGLIPEPVLTPLSTGALAWSDSMLRVVDDSIMDEKMNAWPDEWLIAAVRREPPDAAALNVLAERYWKPLFGRCQLLTLDQDKARDLAQQAWCRLLRVRHTLKPDGNFPAFLTTIATNLWRDSRRSARRAGPLADHRLASLDAAFPTEDGESAKLADTLPDLNSLRAQEQKLLALDIDQALQQLTPLLRDVLVSRLLDGESCIEIGRRYDRTQQTISAWVRQAVREMKQHLEEFGRAITVETKQ